MRRLKNNHKKASPEQEQDVILEFKAFAAGGQGSLDILQRVWPNILREYKVDSIYLDPLLHKAGLYMRIGKIKSFRCQDGDDNL